MDFATGFVAFGIDDAYAVASNLGQVALLQVNKLLCHRQKRGHTTGDEILAVTDTDDERTCDTTYYNPVRIFSVDDQQRIGTFKSLHCFANSFDEIHALFQVVIYKVRGDLCVRFRIEHVALLEHFVLDRLEIFDDAIVNHGNAATRNMRVRVRLGDATVRRPASVCDTDISIQRIFF